jgi:hypothetical protein
LLNPLRPLSTTYPPGTLPPSAALDELTSQVIHFHQPAVAESSTRNLQIRAAGHPGISTSRSAPSLKSDSHHGIPPARQKHRRTHSSSGILWTHSWRATRRKLYEIARKEALGDSREDRFKGRLDISKRGLTMQSGFASGAISPMPENMYGARTFDFGLQGTSKASAASIPLLGDATPTYSPDDDRRSEPRFGGFLRYVHCHEVRAGCDFTNTGRLPLALVKQVRRLDRRNDFSTCKIIHVPQVCFSAARALPLRSSVQHYPSKILRRQTRPAISSPTRTSHQCPVGVLSPSLR